MRTNLVGAATDELKARKFVSFWVQYGTLFQDLGLNGFVHLCYASGCSYLLCKLSMLVTVKHESVIICILFCTVLLLKPNINWTCECEPN